MNRRKLLKLLPLPLIGLATKNLEANDRVNAFTNTIKQDWFSIVTCYEGGKLLTKSSNKLSHASNSIEEAVRLLDYAYPIDCGIRSSIRYYLFYGDIPRAEWANIFELKKYRSISHEHLCKLDKYKIFHNIENSKLGEFISINYI